MAKLRLVAVYIAVVVALRAATPPADGDFRIALGTIGGLLKWSAVGFRSVETSATPTEIGIRAQDQGRKRTVLAFLFQPPGVRPVTNASCRDGVMAERRKGASNWKESSPVDIPTTDGKTISVVAYSSGPAGAGGANAVRGFIAGQSLCGDIEIYSDETIRPQDPAIHTILASVSFDATYQPMFADAALHAEMLFRKGQPRSAGPLWEKALGMVPADGSPFPSALIARRVARDQAGMSYGMSGNIAAARAIFEQGVKEDPDYPMFYYNLACADAEEKNIAAARTHLQQAFDRRTNVNPGEKMPNPTEDDSFTPFRSNKEFWAFLQKLIAK